MGSRRLKNSGFADNKRGKGDKEKTQGIRHQKNLWFTRAIYDGALY
jgi:hypothetical protein